MEPTYLTQLNPPQKEAVLHVEGPLLILAGAGSGKTRVIVSRIAHLVSLGVRPWNILAVTFTNKAAGEMRQRVDTLVPGQGRAVWVSTFHSFCAQFLRVEGKTIGLDPNYVIYDDSDQLSLVKEILKEMMLNEKQCPPGQMVNAISRAKDELLDAGSYAIHAHTHQDPFRERVARVYGAYQRKLRSANALDFGDLIMRTVESLRDFVPLREKYQKRFQFLMIDEYQDTNHAQYLMVKYLSGPKKNVCVVGDDDQSIYSWRGATIRNILEFEKDYPGAKVVKLEQNYRSSKKILDTAGRLIAHNEKRKAKALWTENSPGEDVRFVEMMNEQEEARFVVEEILRLTQEGKGSGGKGGKGSGLDATRPDPFPPFPPDPFPFSPLELKDLAVFYRTNAQSRVFEDALRRTSLPYTIVGALRFYERAEIKDALAYLRVIVNPRDSIGLKRIINLPARGLGKNSMGLIEQYAASQGISLFEAFQNAHAVSGVSTSARNGIKSFLSLHEVFKSYAQGFPAATVVRRVLDESGYWNHWADKAENDPEAAERLDNLQELINAAKDFEEKMAWAHAEGTLSNDSTQTTSVPLPEAEPRGGDRGGAPLPASPLAGGGAASFGGTLARFVQDISLMTDLDEWKDLRGTVTLMTVHLAKGLEFPAVFVTGLEEGLFPIGDSSFDQDELEEERRLAYVAMTRAKVKLYLTSAASRRIYGSPHMNIPSRFISEAGVQTNASYQTSDDSSTSQLSAHEDDFNQDPEGRKKPLIDDTEAALHLSSAIKAGVIIDHPDFGVGRVLEKEGSGSHAKITVQFRGGVKKKLLLKYAPIKIV